MPDWTYHPFFKPVLFLLPAEPARRVTLGLLAIQSKTAPGRALFRLFGHGHPPRSLEVEAFGVRFPSAVGLAPGIDREATALSVLQYLGLGFMEIGPASRRAVQHTFGHDPIRLDEAHAIVECPRASAPSIAALMDRVRASPDLKTPVGIALRGPDLPAAIEAGKGASFFTLPFSVLDDDQRLRELRAVTETPLLVRIPVDLDEAELDARVDAAVAAKLDGCVIVGARTPLRPDGELDAPTLRAPMLAAVARTFARHGERFPIVASVAIFSPDDVIAALDAGARLVELHAGLVFAGPGLPGRIVHALEHRVGRAPHAHDEDVAPMSTTPAKPALALSWHLTAFTGLMLILSGLFALILAATIKLLPYDTHYLGMTVQQLCDRHACRIVHFMAHDRVSFGGSIMSIGILYLWLGAGPLRRGEAWSFWVVVFSGIVGFGSFLTYLGFGYFDEWHGRATAALLPVFLFGLVRSAQTLSAPRGLTSFRKAFTPAWRWSPATMGRVCLSFAAFGMIAGGALIMGVGMTRVFVPQDLEFMQTTAAEIQAINPRLIPLIAHDRAGFGGGLCSTGITVMLMVWFGIRPGARGLYWALLLSGFIGFATAIGVHPIVGYNSFIHLAPAYAGAIAFVIGMALLYRPMCRTDPAPRFSDL